MERKPGSQAVLDARPLVLLSWTARKSDPYNPDADDGRPGRPGPTLVLLFDESSPYRGRIGDAVFLYRVSPDGSDTGDRRTLGDLRKAIHERDPVLRLSEEAWTADDPTDLQELFNFLRDKVPEIQERFRGREFVIHVSPGTPSMQTLWLLLGESGFIKGPFTLVRALEPQQRRGRPAVVPVKLGFETFYRAYRESRPRRSASPEQALAWDPARFRSPRLRALYDEARRFARLKVPVLLLGERGTGKTTLAAWIRANSPYRRKESDAAWPTVACGQYSPETMRSELFGHERGAFTGANRKQEGLLALADKDTLFLDEVGDVSRDLQRLLIRALEEKQYLPLGARRPMKSDFRLLTATNRPLPELEQQLDRDFMDRISPLRLQLPPLRDLPEDLPWLWEYVHGAATVRSSVTPLELPAEQHRRIVEALGRHPLPGNLRDLFQVAYRLLAALSDEESPLSPAEAVDYALEALCSSTPEGRGLVHQVAAAFAQGLPLDPLLGDGVRLPTREIQRDLKRYFATELRRIAETRSVSPEALGDVTERTLQEWIKDDSANKASEAPKKGSSIRREERASE